MAALIQQELENDNPAANKKSHVRRNKRKRKSKAMHGQLMSDVDDNDFSLESSDGLSSSLDSDVMEVTNDEVRISPILYFMEVDHTIDCRYSSLKNTSTRQQKGTSCHCCLVFKTMPKVPSAGCRRS
jgi:hypothetical protein